ncbi:hypothetical protein [Nocardiopsis lucentensis]|uniref:hypothetical protein n=1 Tax=Nocardiopsis lucentensis TaxID=53441 RepID=UPI0003481D12|nr:hypothetical protein [Nocardiopsis lucentensis]
MMKTMSRVLITAVAAPTLAFGLPTAAFADSFYEADQTVAGPHGASSTHVCSAAFDRGGFGFGFGFGNRGCDDRRGPWIW